MASQIQSHILWRHMCLAFRRIDVSLSRIHRLALQRPALPVCAQLRLPQLTHIMSWKQQPP